MAVSPTEKKLEQAELTVITDIICRKDIQEAREHSDTIKNNIIKFSETAVAVDSREILKLMVSWGLLESCFAAAGPTGLQPLLAEAVSEGRLECLKILLESVLERYGNKTAADSANILMQRIPGIKGSHLYITEIFDILFSFGADVNKVFVVSGNKRATVLHNYIRCGEFAAAEKLLGMPQFSLAHAVRVDGGYSLVRSFIEHSCIPGSPLMEKVLSADTLDIKNPPADEPNLISLAIKNSCLGPYMLPMVSALIKAGVETGDINDPGSAAFAAAKCDDIEVRKLIEGEIGRKCAPKLTASQERMFKAIRQNDLQALVKEIKAGADVNVEKNPFTNRITPLMAAVLTGASSQIVRALLEAGADPNAKDIKDCSPVDMVIMYQTDGPKVRIGKTTESVYNGVRMLSRYKVSDENEFEDAAAAIFVNTREVLELLVSAGADISKTDADEVKKMIANFKWYYSRRGAGNNKEYFSKAAETIADMVHILINAGADLNLHDIFKYSVLYGVAPTARKLLPPDYVVNEKFTTQGTYYTGFGDRETTIFLKAVSDACDMSVIEFLLDIGADHTVKDSLGHNAEYYLQNGMSMYNTSSYRDDYYQLIDRKHMEKVLKTEDMNKSSRTHFEFDI